MRGLKQDRSAGVVIAGHAFVQNLRRDQDELAVEVALRLRTQYGPGQPKAKLALPEFPEGVIPA